MSTIYACTQCDHRQTTDHPCAMCWGKMKDVGEPPASFGAISRIDGRIRQWFPVALYLSGMAHYDPDNTPSFATEQSAIDWAKTMWANRPERS